MARVLLTGRSGAGKSTLLAALARRGYLTVTRYVTKIEPLIRRTATLELDGLLEVSVLADRVEECLRS